jgi:hypothetical protein
VLIAKPAERRQDDDAGAGISDHSSRLAAR